MVQIQELEEYKKQLHSDIDRIFDTTNQDRRNFSMDEFKMRSKKFLNNYYEQTVKTSDELFSQDPVIPEFLKMRNATLQGTKGEQLLDKGVLNLLDLVNDLSHAGTEDFNKFTHSANEAIQFVFRIYMKTFSHMLPKFLKNFNEEEVADNPEFLTLKRLLDSLGYDLFQCFNRAKVNHQWKLPLTMIFCSELQEQVVRYASENLAVEKLSIGIANKVLPNDLGGEIDTSTLMKAITEAKKEMTPEGIKKRECMVFYYMLRVTTDLYISNLQSFLAENVLRDFDFPEDIKQNIANIKSNLLNVANDSFRKIK